MRLIILLATLAIILPFVISQVATPLGLAVSLRFLERPTNAAAPHYTIPLEIAAPEPLNAESLAGGYGRGYITRVMPLDILYLIFLGAFSVLLA